MLVVDDNVDSARGLARILKRSGYDVHLAHDGPSALEAARAQRPEIIILDIGLPGLDGYHVAEQLRREAPTREATIIALSGYGQDQDRERSRAAGFDHHLVKPVDLGTLLGLLAEPRPAPP